MTEVTEKIKNTRSKPEYINEDIDSVLDIEANFAYWSKMPYWSLEESVALLLGKEPESIDWDIVQHHLEWPFATELSLNYAKLRDLILRAVEMKEIEEQNTPTCLILWADSRGIDVPEELRILVDDISYLKAQMDSEIEDLLNDKDEEIATLKKRISELETCVWQGFDESQSTYAKELAIAVKAHVAISKNWKKGVSIKKQISHWLQQNYPALMNEERERISKICNWQKNGGAPATPGTSS